MFKPALILLPLAIMLSCGQNTPLSEYEAKSAREQAVKTVLLAFQAAVRDHDAEGVIELIHDKAAIMIGNERRMLSKSEYAQVLPSRLAEDSRLTLGRPRMAFTGGKAEVKIYMTRGDNRFLMTFNLELDHDKWYIKSWQY